MRLLFVRHGQSEGNAAGLIQGRLDYGLTELGVAQAQATAAALRLLGVERLVSSPLKRARTTAEFIAAACALELETDERLAEYDVGDVSGLTGAEIRERFPEVVAQYRQGLHPRFPGEEGREHFHARVAEALARLWDGARPAAVVTHGGVVSAICYQVLGLDPARRGIFENANCAITEIGEDRGGRRVIIRHNDTCHLEGPPTTFDGN
jgi:probable phosphoglycerate mutase